MDPFNQSPQDRALLDWVLRILNIWEPYHQRFTKTANHHYGLYRNVQNWRKQLQDSASPRGRDGIFRDGQSEFGTELFIPMVFATIETIIAAMLATPPSMDGIEPRFPAGEGSVDALKAMIEFQQEQIDYELRLQSIAKDGLIYGTGVQKTYWKESFQKRKRWVNSSEPGGGLVEVQTLQQVFDDPDAISIDPKDFIVDPFADSIENSEGAFHRAWRSDRYVQRMIEAKKWRNLDGVELGPLADSSKFDELRAERERAVPQPARETTSMRAGKQPVHEVLEFHDGEQVITILDRKVVVAAGPNPNWHGRLPFQVYRPTERPHEIHGTGEVEPIEKLQEELNSLRTERRYNAALVLQKVFAYHEGLVERDDIAFGPGYAIGVNGDPRELLQEIRVGDIPNSSYMEEDRITSGADKASGLSDTVMGAGLNSGDTATGVQLVQSAASRRIELKTRRLDLEIIDPGGQQFLELTQQRLTENKTIPVPAPPSPGQPDRRWTWLQIEPNQLMGEWTVKSRKRSTQPENIPQNRADAQMAATLLGQLPVVDQRKVATFVIRNIGVDNPESWLAPPEATVPAATLDRLAEHKVPPELIAQALAEAGGPDFHGGNPPGAVGEPPGSPPPPEAPEEGGGEGGKGEGR